MGGEIDEFVAQKTVKIPQVVRVILEKILSTFRTNTTVGYC